MSVHEEVEEHVHHAQTGFDKLVAATMAAIAAVLAVVSLLAQHFNTEKLLEQQKASDMWAYYQAKDIRRYSALMAQDIFTQAHAPQLAAKYAADSQRYRQQTAEEQKQAREFERERDKMGSQADSFHFAEVFLEVAIVLSSLSILMKLRPLFFGGIASALAGVVISTVGYLMYR